MENFVLVIQIRIVEIKEENLVLVNSKKGEVRKKDFFPKPKNREERRRCSVI